MLTKSAQGNQNAATTAGNEGLWAPQGVSGTGLGRVWNAPTDLVGAKLDPKVDFFGFQEVLIF